MQRQITFILILLFSLLSNGGFSQNNTSAKEKAAINFTYPTLRKTGKTPMDVIPKGWDIVDSLSGNISKDSIAAEVVVLEYQDSIKLKKEWEHPRMLLIIFKAGDNWELKLQHNTLIVRTDILDGDHFDEYDPYQSMEISKGILRLHFVWTERSWGTNLQYVIRYQSNDFYLIGATSEFGHHSDTETFDFNFSTKKYTHHVANYDSGFGGEDIDYIEKKTLPANDLKKLSEIKEAFQWQVTEGVSI